MPELKVHSFIVKLWLEESGHNQESVGWHGYITHVPSGERRYLQELRDILSFVKPYVAEIGADATIISRVGHRMKSWMHKNR
jgi:hypothetical protein